MLTTLLPLPGDRAESAPRRDVADAPPGPRFADLLQQRRSAAAPAADPKASRQASDPPRDAAAASARSARGGARSVPAQPDRNADARDAGTEADRPGADAIDVGATPAAEVTDGAAAKKPSSPADGGTEQGTPAPQGVDPTSRMPASDAAQGHATAPASASTASARRPAPAAGASTHEGADTAEAAGSAVASPNPALPADRQTALPAPDAARPTPASREAVPAGAPLAAPRFADAIAAPPPAALLPAPLHAPEFAQVLGAQVSLYARDGVQQAELRINPPEMGPIGVQIEIDGRDARVSFHAGQAATREVIERALPELAAALRSEGLTLAGGGVFDGSGSADARQQARAEARLPAQGTTDPQSPTTQPRARALHTPQGMLDLYA